MTQLTVRNIDDEGIDNLKEAIVMQAVKDYRKALYEVRKARLPRSKREILRRICHECESFFRSDWFSQLTSGEIDGERVIEEIRRSPARKYVEV